MCPSSFCTCCWGACCATWTPSFYCNLFSSTISWEGSLSENKPLSLKQDPKFNFCFFSLFLIIFLFILYFTLLVFPHLPAFSVPCLFPHVLFLFKSPCCSPPVICSSLMQPDKPRARVSCYSSSSLIKLSIVRVNPSETIKLFKIYPAFWYFCCLTHLKSMFAAIY